MQVLSLWNRARPGFELDIFVEEPFVFEEVWRRTSRVVLADHSIPVISVPDLIEMKRAAGRSRDLEDVEALVRLSEGASDEE